jgi:GDP-L-fucose synthase
VGSAIKRAAANSPHNFIFWGHANCDLTDSVPVYYKMLDIMPDYVIHTAAKVGGIGGNLAKHGEYFYDNIMMNTNIIESSRKLGVKKLIAFSSVCVFPDGASLLREDNMHNGKPCDFNFAYANAKRMIDIQIEANKRQYGTNNYCSIILSNTFGENDLYSLAYGHVIPSLIHKLYVAKTTKTPFYVWGDGSAKREFLYSGDVAVIILALLEKDLPQRIIVSSKVQYSIKQVVEALVNIANFRGDVIFDTTKPNGQLARPTDTTLLSSLVDTNHIDLKAGLKLSWDWFVSNYPNVRL